MVEKNQSENSQDTVGQRIVIRRHELGGIAVEVTGSDGNTSVARIGIDQAWQLAGQLNGIANVELLMQIMAQQQAAATSGLILP
jgi:predicted porin